MNRYGLIGFPLEHSFSKKYFAKKFKKMGLSGTHVYELFEIEFLKNYAANIFILSNGFKDFIVPIVAKYDIPKENVYANEFVYDEAGNISGFDKENVLPPWNIS